MTSITSGQALRFAAAAGIGALVGFAVYRISQFSGLYLFVTTGAVLGFMSVLVVHVYNRSARLTEVRLSVPHFSQLTFVVNDHAKQVAWRLFIETVTRVSTQPLNREDGLIREALSSLYGLFATTRDTLKAGRPSVVAPGTQTTVEHLAIAMLNRSLRPFLSKWHPRLLEFETASPDQPESAWPDNAACRAELRRVQRDVYEYALNFARLAGVGAPERMLMPPAPADVAESPAPQTEPPAAQTGERDGAAAS